MGFYVPVERRRAPRISSKNCRPTALWRMTAWAHEGAIGLRHSTSVAVAVELAVRHKHYGARSSASHCFKFYSTNFN